MAISALIGREFKTQQGVYIKVIGNYDTRHKKCIVLNSNKEHILKEYEFIFKNANIVAESVYIPYLPKAGSRYNNIVGDIYYENKVAPYYTDIKTRYNQLKEPVVSKELLDFTNFYKWSIDRSKSGFLDSFMLYLTTDYDISTDDLLYVPTCVGRMLIRLKDSEIPFVNKIQYENSYLYKYGQYTYKCGLIVLGQDKELAKTISNLIISHRRRLVSKYLKGIIPDVKLKLLLSQFDKLKIKSAKPLNTIPKDLEKRILASSLETKFENSIKRVNSKFEISMMKFNSKLGKAKNNGWTIGAK